MRNYKRSELIKNKECFEKKNLCQGENEEKDSGSGQLVNQQNLRILCTSDQILVSLFQLDNSCVLIISVQ